MLGNRIGRAHSATVTHALFFPYTVNAARREIVRNPHLRRWREGMVSPLGGGPRSDEIPGSLSSVPFRWQYYEQFYDMRFLGGFVGVRQDPASLTVSPQLGWAIGEQ